MLSKINTSVKQGEVIFFSTGIYSDYGYCGELVFIKSANLAGLAKEYRCEINPNEEIYNDNIRSFPGWLVAKGYCLPLDCREIHLGDDSFEPEFLA